MPCQYCTAMRRRTKKNGRRIAQYGNMQRGPGTWHAAATSSKWQKPTHVATTIRPLSLSHWRSTCPSSEARCLCFLRAILRQCRCIWSAGSPNGCYGLAFRRSTCFASWSGRPRTRQTWRASFGTTSQPSQCHTSVLLMKAGSVGGLGDAWHSGASCWQ